jgi:SnoaL-like domain
MSASPVEQLLGAVDRRDVDAVMALSAPDVRLLTVDGRRAHGKDAVRELLTTFLGGLRSSSHRITAQWHVDDVWIAEIDASYELQDWLRLNDLPRVFVVRMGPDGIADLRAYGAHEHPLADHRTGEEGMWVGSRWIPPL